MLDNLINNGDCMIRKAVAKQGYGLDMLINDPSWEVWSDVTNTDNFIKELIQQ